MKNKICILLFAFIARWCFLSDAFAYDAKIDGVYYKLNYANHTAIVTYGNYEVSYKQDEVYVPSKVIYNEQEFIVDSVDNNCFSRGYMKRVILPNTIRGIGGDAFFLSKVEEVIIPSGTQYIGKGLVGECDKLKYLEIGESVQSIENVRSRFYNSGYDFKNDVVVKWNAIHSQDFEIGNRKYISELSDYFYPDASTPFWKGTDDYEHIYYPDTKKDVWHNYNNGSHYVMRHNITEFVFGQKVEYIPAHLCFRLKRLKTITIPKSVRTIGTQAFGECDSISSVTIEALTPPIGNGGLSTNIIVYVPCQAFEAYLSSADWSKYNLQINPYSYESSSTSAIISFGCGDTKITSISIQGGETTIGNTLEFNSLDPENEYKDIPIVLTSNFGETETVSVSFSTTALELTTLPSKPVSSSTAILLAQTNMADIETSCGFEYKRKDAPVDMAGTQVLCPVANGLLAGRLKGLKDDVYYKYRAFYKSAAGKMYYGDWQYIFTGDVAVEFDPVLYTYAAQFVTEHDATLKGYALPGADDFTEQGFEYWADSRNSNAPSRRTPQYAFGEKQTIQANGISMRVTLDNLDEGTVYKYRTYAKIGDKTLYGTEMSFTTEGKWIEYTLTATAENSTMGDVTGSGTYHTGTEVTIEAVPATGYKFVQWSDGNTDNPRTVIVTEDMTITASFKSQAPTSVESANEDSGTPIVRKFIENGILYIECNGNVYNTQGKKLLN